MQTSPFLGKFGFGQDAKIVWFFYATKKNSHSKVNTLVESNKPSKETNIDSPCPS